MMRQIKQSLFVILLAALLASIPLTLAQGSPATWSPPEFLGNGWWQSLSVDREGTVHVGWYSGEEKDKATRQDIDQLMYRQKPLDGEWTESTDIIYTGMGGFTVRNTLDVTSDGDIFAFYRGHNSHYIARSTVFDILNPLSWTTPQMIADNGYYLDMMVDKNDNIHLVTSYTSTALLRSQSVVEVNPCAFCKDLFHMRSDDRGATWSRTAIISDLPESGSDRPDIWQAPSGRLYISWDEGLDWYIGRGQPKDVRIAYSDDDGLTWSDPIILDGGEAAAELQPIQLAAAEIENGSILAVWRSAILNTIYYQLSDDLGETWTEPRPIPGIAARPNMETSLDDYELITDNFGDAHLFAIARPRDAAASVNSLYHMEYRQGRWLPGRVIAIEPEDKHFLWPKAAFGPLNDIHLTWFETDRFPSGTSTGPTGLEVYYSHRTGNMEPATALAFNPTSTPSPTPELQTLFEATPTPFPTAVPMERVPSANNSDQYVTRTLLTSMFFVTLFCGGVFLAYRNRGRR